MKKALSFLLTVSLLFALLMPTAVSADDTVSPDYQSLLPSSASQFKTVDTTSSDTTGTVFVSKSGDSFVFEGTALWPSAYCNYALDGIRFHKNDDLYLYYDFEVVRGATNIIVYFGGQDPIQMTIKGCFLCLNGLVDPSYVDPATGEALQDVPVGKYKGRVGIRDMGYSDMLEYDNGDMLISGMKVFAVGNNSKIIVNDVFVDGPRDGYDDSSNNGGNNNGNEDNNDNDDNSGHDDNVVSAAGAFPHSFLPDSEDQFVTMNTPHGTISVTKADDSFVFKATTEWPSAHYCGKDVWFYCHEDEDLYLYYDFEVVKGHGTVYLYFAGQDPTVLAPTGTYVCVNGLINPSYIAPSGDAVVDLPVGQYKGKISIKDLDYYYGEAYKTSGGNMLISGFKVFPIGDNGELVVNDIVVAGPLGADDGNLLTGDVTRDDIINMMDVSAMFQGSSGANSLTTLQKAAADYDGNGIFNMMDIMSLYNKISGK